MAKKVADNLEAGKPQCFGHMDKGVRADAGPACGFTDRVQTEVGRVIDQVFWCRADLGRNLDHTVFEGVCGGRLERRARAIRL